MRSLTPNPKPIRRGSRSFVALCLVVSGIRTMAEAPRRPDAGPWPAPVHHPYVRVTTHLVRSHTLDLVSRPFSSLGQGVFYLTDQGVGLVHRADIRFRRMPILGIRPVPAVSGVPGMDLEQWERELDRLTMSSAEQGRLRYLIGGPPFFNRLEEALRDARRSIHMQSYIFDNDDVARDLADLLRDRSAALDVKLLYDGLGTYMAQHVHPEGLPAGYRPPTSMHRYLESGSRVRVRAIGNTWLAGDHVKCTIVDGERAFLGGMNIGREYRYAWHDMMVELGGPVVEALEQRFRSAWEHAGFRGDLACLANRPRRARQTANPSAGTYPIRLIHNGTGLHDISKVHIAALNRARSYAYLENAYLADDALILALCRARKRGVDVRVILPEKSNHNVMQRNHRVVTKELLRHGVRVYEYPGMSHIKAGVIDGWACLGTANFDKLSLQVNRELNIATSHPGAVDELLRGLLLKDMEKSTEIVAPPTPAFADYVFELVADEL